MTGNEHFTTAQQTFDKFSSGAGLKADQQAVAIAAAQLHATLALAYEQRTANLIAMWTNPEATLMDLSKGRPVTSNIGVANADSFLAQILERLGVAK